MENKQDREDHANQKKEGVSKDKANTSASKKPLPPSFTSSGKEDVCPNSSEE
jgi:WD40 repeat protein